MDIATLKYLTQELKFAGRTIEIQDITGSVTIHNADEIVSITDKGTAAEIYFIFQGCHKFETVPYNALVTIGQVSELMEDYLYND